MSNDVRIRVHWDDPDGDKFAASQKAKAKRAGEQAGDAFAGATRRKASKAGEDAADDFNGSFSGKLTKSSINAAQKAGQEAAKSFSGNFSGSLGDELGKAGEDAAKKTRDGFEKESKKTPAKLPVKADNPIDAAWRKDIEASIKHAASGAIKIPATPDTEMFRQDLEASLKKAAALLKTEVPVKPEEAAAFRAKLQAMVDAAEAGVKANIPAEVDEAKARNSARKAGAGVEQEMNKVAKRSQSQFEALRFIGLSVGLPAAAAVGAAGVTVALAAMGAGFAALGVYAASSSEKVQVAAKSMANNVLDDVNGMGQAVEGDIIETLQGAGKAWDRLTPQVQAAVAASGPAIRELGGSVTDFAENAMPGMLTAVQRSEPVFKGLRSFTGQAGQGLAEFFTNASQGSDAAGAGMSRFGGTVQLLEARLGTLFANLANGSAGPLNSLHVLVDEATGALVRMTAQGSGVMGFLQGFSTTGSGLITVLSGLASVVSSLPPGLNQIGGSLTATSMLLSKFGIDATAGFEGFGSKLKNLGSDLVNARNPMNSLKEAGAGLVSGAFNPAAIATVGLSVLLAELGRRQEEAAAKAQAHATNVQNLTSALREDGGVIGTSISNTTAKALADKNAAGNAAALGVSLGTVQSAAMGNGDAMSELTGRANQLYDSFIAQGKVGSDNAWMFREHAKALAANGGAAQDAAYDTGNLTQAERDQLDAALNVIGAAGEQSKSLRDTQEAARSLKSALSGVSVEQLKLNEASTIGQAASANLAAAFGTLAQAGGDVQSKGNALIDVFDALHGSQLTAEEAQQAWNDQMREAADSMKNLDLPKHAKDFINTAGAINTTSEAGSKLQNFVREAAGHMAAFAQSLKDQGKSSQEITQALAPMEGQLRNQLKAWGLNDQEIQKVLEHYGAIPSEIQTVLKVSGGEASKVQVQTVLEELLKVPPEKGVKVSTLTEDAKKNLEELGYQVVALPDGTFQVFANTQPGRDAASALIGEVNHYQGTVTVHANTADAVGAVQVWQQRADGTIGMTTTDTRVDPATGKVQTWLAQANGTWAWTNTDSRIDPATGKVQLWVASTNGKWAWVNADARTGAAEGALNYAARTRTAVIQGVFIAPSISGLGAAANRLAKGGMVGYAAGGEIRSVPRFAEGGSMLDIRAGGIMRGPGTGTSDSILALSSRGPIAGSAGEMVIRASQTRKWRPLLEAINAGVNGFAGGGPIQAEDGSWVSSSFYGPAPKGPHPMLTEEGYAKLRARATANGIGSLPPILQDQLRTYGGWVDSLPSAAGAQPSSSGNATSSGRVPVTTIRLVVDLSGADTRVLDWLRDRIRVEGGDVQMVLGRN
ncbi:hypothetical protein [Amycolatopsis sp. NPDC004378]